MPGDITFATFNLYNLQVPEETYYGKSYSPEQYRQKIEWSADLVRKLNADVIAFQELWNARCLEDIFSSPVLAGQYSLHFIKPTWYNIAVAAAVRNSWAVSGTVVHKEFPDEFKLVKRLNRSDEDDDIDVTIGKFSRSILQVNLNHSTDPAPDDIHVFCTHLKSKLPTRLDREENDNPAFKHHDDAVGAAISTIRRTAEAAALRWILTEDMKDTNHPVVVLGDFNDSQLSNTLAIIGSQPTLRLREASRAGNRSDTGLYSAGSL